MLLHSTSQRSRKLATPRGNVPNDNIVCRLVLQERDQNGVSLWPGTLENHPFIESPLKGAGKGEEETVVMCYAMSWPVGNRKDGGKFRLRAKEKDFPFISYQYSMCL